MICLFPDCGLETTKTRGLCAKHCQAFRKLIKAGKVTWTQLEAAGMSQKPTRLYKGEAEKLLIERGIIKL